MPLSRSKAEKVDMVPKQHPAIMRVMLCFTLDMSGVFAGINKV